MAGHGLAPAKTRRRTNEPGRGEWIAASHTGWQHGAMPSPPKGLLKSSRDAWVTWLGAWYAAHWRPEDLPSLRQVIRLYDQVERGEFQRSGELRLAQDTWGISPKGQQDRRWVAPPIGGDPETMPEPEAEEPPSRYGHLRPVVNE